MGLLDKLSSLFGKEPATADGVHSEAELKELLARYYPQGAPSVSIVSVLYRKAYALPLFLETVFRQYYPGPIEIIFVGDKSPDHSIAVARKTFKGMQAQFTGREHPIVQRLLTNEEQMGNCYSLNVGREKASGDLIVFADADCLLNRLFLAHHAVNIAKTPCDISTGPGLRYDDNAKAAKALIGYEKKPAQMLEAARAIGTDFQAAGAADLHVYCDCKTRNFCALNEKLPRPLFNELYSQQQGGRKNCCVEGADMGQLLAESGGLRLSWIAGAFNLRLVEPPFVESDDDDDDDY